MKNCQTILVENVAFSYLFTILLSNSRLFISIEKDGCWLNIPRLESSITFFHGMCSINDARQVKTKYLPIISRLQMSLPNKSVGHIRVGQKVVENYTCVITSSSGMLGLSVRKGAIRCKSYKINNVLSIVVRTHYIINGS